MNIDYHKSEYDLQSSKFEILRDTFSWNTSRNKNDIIYKWWLKDHCITITIIRKNKNAGYKLIISGSLHKYSNCISGLGPISFNHLSHNEIINPMTALYDKYMVSVEDARLQQLEYSINIITKLLPKRIIDEMIYLFKHKESKINDFYDNGGRGIYFKSGKMLVKIYDKGKESQLNYNLIRIEIHYLANEPLSKIGIINVCDLLNEHCMITLADELFNAINTLQIIDIVDHRDLSEKESKMFDNFTIKKKYASLKRNVSGTTLWRKEKEFNKFLKDKNLNCTKDSFLNEILIKI